MHRSLILARILIVLFVLASFNSLSATELVRLCGQNLKRFGERPVAVSRQRRNQQTELISRFKRASCDVIALQEIYGESARDAAKNLNRLCQAYSATFSSKRSSELIGCKTGKTNDPYIRNGILWNNRRLELIETRSYADDVLPPANKLGPVSRFARGPLAARFRIRSSSPVQEFTVVSFHLKSKAKGWKDISGLKFELHRLQMAAGLLKIAQTHIKNGQRIILIGDRNSTENSASAAVLRGVLSLDDFRYPASCSVAKTLAPACNAEIYRIPQLVGLLAYGNKESNVTGRFASYRFKDQYEIIDEILVRGLDLKLFVNQADKKVRAGVLGRFGRGSDHKLIWADMLPTQ